MKKVVQKDELGRFNLKNSQTAPYNIFLSLDKLNDLMNFKGKANQILISTNLKSAEVEKVVDDCLTPEDAGLIQKKIEAVFSKNHPEKWMPLYSQVSFSHIRYSEALRVGQLQDDIMKKVMSEFENIEDVWDSNEVQNRILNYLEEVHA